MLSFKKYLFNESINSPGQGLLASFKQNECKQFCLHVFHDMDQLNKHVSELEKPEEHSGIEMIYGIRGKLPPYFDYKAQEIYLQGKYEIKYLTLTDEYGTDREHLYTRYISCESGKLHNIFGPASVSLNKNGDLENRYYIYHGQHFYPNAHGNTFANFFYNTDDKDLMRLKVAVLKESKKRFIQQLFVDVNCATVLKHVNAFSVKLLEILLQEEFFKDIVVQRALILVASLISIPAELEYEILSKDPSLAHNLGQIDKDLLDKVKNMDKKYGLNLAEEIEARLS